MNIYCQTDPAQMAVSVQLTKNKDGVIIHVSHYPIYQTCVIPIDQAELLAQLISEVATGAHDPDSYPTEAVAPPSFEEAA